MASVTARALEHNLLALSDEAFATFVAECWAASGWSVSIDGSVVEATRSGDTRRLLVLPPRRVVPELRGAPDVEPPIDAIVSPYRAADRSRLPGGLPDAPIVDADGLRERLRYAIDEADADRLLASHLGIDADEALGDARSGRSPPPVVHLPQSGTVVPVGLGLLLVVAGLAVLLAATGAFAPGDSTGTVNASGPTTAGAYTTSTASVYDAQPTCERSPREVATLSSDAVRGSSLGHGLGVLGRFWNPRFVDQSRSGFWNDRMRSDVRRAYYDAPSVTIGEAQIDGRSAIVPAVARIDGTERQYAFEFTKRSQTPYEGCWVVDYFGPERSA